MERCFHHDWTRRSFLSVCAGSALAACAKADPALPGAPAAPSIPILAYHRFDPVKWGSTTVTMSVLEEQLGLLAGAGFNLIGLGEAIERLRGGTTDQDRYAVLTADDGHKSIHSVLFPFLRARGLPITLFVYPDGISHESQALKWKQLDEMRRTGLVNVQSHSFTHPRFDLERAQRTPDSFAAFVAEELGRSRQMISDRLGTPVDFLAWPYGVVDEQLEQAARKAGYRAAFGYGGGPAAPGMDFFALPRVGIDQDVVGQRFLRAIQARSARTTDSARPAGGGLKI